jgi:hypothetical protein
VRCSGLFRCVREEKSGYSQTWCDNGLPASVQPKQDTAPTKHAAGPRKLSYSLYKATDKANADRDTQNTPIKQKPNGEGHALNKRDPH